MSDPYYGEQDMDGAEISAPDDRDELLEEARELLEEYVEYHGESTAESVGAGKCDLCRMAEAWMAKLEARDE